MDLLITSVANGGNLLLNVGPTARGEFDHRAVTALDSLSLWMHANSKSIYHCTFAPADFKVSEGTKLTYNKDSKRLYVHLFEYPGTSYIYLEGYKDKVNYAQFLHDNSEIQIDAKKSTGNTLVLKLPAKKPNFEIPVIELMLN
ncbi:Alpha-L-fucosidase [Pedobacter nyackensis]|uniref:Alpha-L-fucosidase n=1 Tax=Pedobacter nyackensis TaxID=475255 RepID=A0A1W2D3K6_9SPHI|nr:Alpha-L-fucosidase [Pedobacter nyackensis]